MLLIESTQPIGERSPKSPALRRSACSRLGAWHGAQASRKMQYPAQSQCRADMIKGAHAIKSIVTARVTPTEYSHVQSAPEFLLFLRTYGATCSC